MTSRPVPDHGTYARANGSPGYREPCKCDPCLAARSKKKKAERLNRQLNRPARLDASLAARRLRQLNKSMGWKDLAAALGTSGSHIRAIASGRIPIIATSTHIKIMRVEQSSSGGQYIDATGSIRRIRALIAIGHSLESIAAAAGTYSTRIQPLAVGHPRLRRFLADRIKVAYQQLSEEHGSNTRGRNRAVANGWPPPAAWDDERIDDPSAAPEWTGFCGTDRGYWTHKLQKLPMCPPCAAAHQQWIDDHADVDPVVRNQRMFAARAAAGTRGADLAHDGRELMRLGCDYEQAAARLGVTRQHLQQELQRHPAPAAAA